jgi:hypothetical protein
MRVAPVVAAAVLSAFVGCGGSGAGPDAGDDGTTPDAADVDVPPDAADVDVPPEAPDGDVPAAESAEVLDPTADYACSASVATDPVAVGERRKVVVLYFRFGDDLHDLAVDRALIGYNFGPNHFFPGGAGYFCTLESPEGEVIDSYREPPPVAVWPEDSGCLLVEPAEADVVERFDFTDPLVRRFRIRDSDADVICSNGTYVGTGAALALVDLEPCREALCATPEAAGDPWCP